MHIIIPLLNKLKLNSSWRARSKSADINTTKYYGHQNSIMRFNSTAHFCLLVCWLWSWVNIGKAGQWEVMRQNILTDTCISVSYVRTRTGTNRSVISVGTHMISIVTRSIDTVGRVNTVIFLSASRGGGCFPAGTVHTDQWACGRLVGTQRAGGTCVPGVIIPCCIVTLVTHVWNRL